VIVINPDAHSVGGLDDLDYGISVARRGWLEKADVWNTLPLKTMRQRIQERAARR
jgi:DNA polymerase (family 10)